MSYPNVNDADLLNQRVEYDPEAELNEINLAPDGYHTLNVELGRDGITVGKTKNGQAFIQAHIMARVVAPGETFDKSVIFDRVSSIVFDSGTSPLHQFLKATGNPAPASSTLQELKDHTLQVLAGKPQVSGRTRWIGSVQTGTSSDGKKTYEDKLKGMRNFAQNPDGTYNPRFTVSVNGRDVEGVAQIKITDWQPVEAAATA